MKLIVAIIASTLHTTLCLSIAIWYVDHFFIPTIDKYPSAVVCAWILAIEWCRHHLFFPEAILRFILETNGILCPILLKYLQITFSALVIPVIFFAVYCVFVMDNGLGNKRRKSFLKLRYVSQRSSFRYDVEFFPVIYCLASLALKN